MGVRPHAIYFRIDRNSPLCIRQVFADSPLDIACEIRKRTISVTSAAFRSDPDDPNIIIDNVGSGRYLYHLGYRSTSNARADEFTVVDTFTAAERGQLRIEQLWTPVAQGDSDGTMNIWFKTNKTDDSVMYSPANASSTNPPNANTLVGGRVTDTRGWQLLVESAPTDSRRTYSIEDLALPEGEYVTAFMFEHGSVEKGFCIGGYGDAGCLEVTYSVTCPLSLSPRATDGTQTSLDTEADCAIYRNTRFDELNGELIATPVLYDSDYTDTSTSVIGSFRTHHHRTLPEGRLDLASQDKGDVPLLFDSPVAIFIMLGACTAIAVGAILLIRVCILTRKYR